MSAALEPDPRLARRRVRAGAALVLVLIALGVAVLITALTPRGVEAVVTAEEPPSVAVVDSSIYVHVLGRVADPGLYALPEGARVIDAISFAGGLAEDADPAGVNLARLLVDGEQLYVPAEGEEPLAPGGGGTAGTVGGRVNLNAADSTTLQTLPRIGPSLAGRIVAWREANGRFASVDDLLAVSGIGESTLAGLRDLITV